MMVDLPRGDCTGSLTRKLPGVIEWCHKHNIRIISPSYPGFGYSQVRPGWTVGQWPKSALVLQQEGVTGKFLLSGTSFGSVHAQSVAVYFGERVTSLSKLINFEI